MKSVGATTALLRGAGIVAVAMAFGQVLAYVVYVLAARRLAPDDFSSLSSLLTIVVIGAVLAFGLQAVSARRIARAEANEHAGIAARMQRFGLLAGLAVAVVITIVSPLLAILLRQTGVGDILVIAVMFVPLTFVGALYGFAQGREDHVRLGALLILGAVGRFGGGLIGLLVYGTVSATLLLTMIGTWVGVGFGWWLVGRSRREPPTIIARLTAEVIHASHALFAFYIATSIDLLLARFFLSGEESGNYAVGAVLTKVALWLPSFIAVVAFPRMAKQGGRRVALMAAAAVGITGAALVGFLALFGGVVLSFVAGPEYADMANYLWIFGVIGSAFALAQFLLYARLAVDDRRAVFAVWLAILGIVVTVVIWHNSFVQIAAIVAGWALLLALVGVVTVAFTKDTPVVDADAAFEIDIA